MTQPTPLKVLGVAGSLRRASYNRALLAAAQKLCPDGVTLDVFDLAPLPLYDQDLDTDAAPHAVQAFRDALWAADAMLIATPEYNHGIPGVLKNALDWASRPPQHQPLKGLPVAIMGATPSMWGTARAQAQLRQVLVFPSAVVMPQPEVLVANATGKFDAEGRLVDDATRSFVHGLMVALAAWTHQVVQPKAPAAQTTVTTT
ncbi:NADPH-dependent FMN reductase [Deinococcus radiopugnans]|uniref:Chromate reductase n=1 Tax=Deinococcus radiopugnans ATCC 19172 TaxID=585398 RepID=A0A5C4XV98_9DEIO|nr:NAD(P)H-dependent oxidoreductase [Deinococcus radiopugnans]MBB6018578.1 chromate reductase [Deinococcus radiopugnans ATCC 19172]TNM67281.1 NAD(P)H-dependent oxidoreductase [Deinococcus radiopugnans ATCC 19172]